MSSSKLKEIVIIKTIRLDENFSSKFKQKTPILFEILRIRF